MDRIAIDFISVMGLPPVEFVELAAKLGVGYIGLAPAPLTSNPHNYPEWTLRGNPALVKDTARALKDNGVTVSVSDGFLIWPAASVSTLAADLDIMAELGALRVNACALEPDPGRLVDEFGLLADMANERGLPLTLEFLPGMPVGTLPAAVDLVRKAGRPNTGLLLDAMHFYQTGCTAADIAALDPALIFYAQLCDRPAETSLTYMDMARLERMCPGEGVLPLRDFVQALPADIILGLEVPMQAKALAGLAPYDRLKPCIEAARALAKAKG
jgi:sugar phosphate isomerase/epimerase